MSKITLIRFHACFFFPLVLNCEITPYLSLIFSLQTTQTVLLEINCTVLAKVSLSSNASSCGAYICHQPRKIKLARVAQITATCATENGSRKSVVRIHLCVPTCTFTLFSYQTHPSLTNHKIPETNHF